MSEGALTAVAASEFDYGALEPAEAERVRSAAVNIRTKLKVATASVGSDLRAVKEMLGHGKFGDWLEAEFGWSDRTARNYIEYADFAQANPEIIANLAPTLVYRLAAKSTPEEARQQILDQVQAGGKVTIDAASRLIAETKERQKEASRRAGLTNEQREREDRNKRARKRREERADAEWQAREDDLRRQRENADKLAPIIARLIADDLEAQSLIDDCDAGHLGHRIVDLVARESSSPLVAIGARSLG